MNWTGDLAEADASVPTIRVITGPTGAGKSMIAMKLAHQRDLSIISADSRQVYRDFNVGTAKPSLHDLETVLHYGVNILDPCESYSAHRWAKDATDWLESLAINRRTALIVGGTGFYIRALTSPLDPVPTLDPVRREALAGWMESMDSRTLAEWCERLDPSRAGLGRTQHIRAIETALLTGKQLGRSFEARAAHEVADGTSSRPSNRRNVHYLVIDPGPVLADRIAQRVRRMLAEGWLDEVKYLVRHVPPAAPAWKATGYERLRACVDLDQVPRPVVERLVIETRQFAKRQRTWFRHQLTDGTVTRLNPDDENALAKAVEWWDKTDRTDK